jgi:hypothetical protein
MRERRLLPPWSGRVHRQFPLLVSRATLDGEG